MEYKKRWSKGLLLLRDITRWASQHHESELPSRHITMSEAAPEHDQVGTHSFNFMRKESAPNNHSIYSPTRWFFFLRLHLVLESSCVFRIVTPHVVKTLFYLKDSQKFKIKKKKILRVWVRKDPYWILSLILPWLVKKIGYGYNFFISAGWLVDLGSQVRM